MPTYRRWRGRVVFLTVVTAARRPLFSDPVARSLLRTAVRQTQADRPWEMTAVVLLPDHLHMIWTLDGKDLDYSVRLAVIKKRFTRAWLGRGGSEAFVPDGQRHHRLRGVWQRRFWEHAIRDARELKMHLDYVHVNPVRHGLVELPRHWPWSSFHRCVRENEYEPDWCGRVDLPGSVEYFRHD